MRRHGIIHRDVKPENILLSDGVPVVADFGIAKAVAAGQRSRTGSNAGITQAGVSLGTPAYMSPEQAMGEENIDGRSDVYALGCLLYELLAGELPFAGPTAHAIIAKHIMTPVPSVRGVRDSVSPVIDSAITRAMAKDPNSRFSSPAEFAAALVAVPPVEPKPDYSRITEPVTRSDAPIVGRRKEVAELFARLDAMEQGHGGLVLVAGEPGVGKTRLTEAALLEARRRGHFCAVGHCYEMEGAPPYLPLVEQLEYAARVAPPGRFRAALGSSAPEIARVAPMLRQLFPDIGPPLDLPPDQQRHFLFARFREYLERSAAGVPLVLLFDDLHWADESTLLFIEHLAPHLSRLRVLLLGTYRDVDLEVDRPFAKSLERLTRQRLAERIVLRRMPESDVAELLATLGAPDPPPSLVQAIYRETEGNPFFIEEVFQHLREEGRLLDADGRWLPDLRIEQLEVPEGVRLVIGRRLERVGTECRAVLAAAAIVGPRFDFPILEALGVGTADVILDALEKAEAAGLILSRAVGRETRYTFARELIRQTLLGALSLPRRQRGHQRTADAIETVYAVKLESKIADLAYHLFQAGAAVATDRTTDALLRAGRQALAAGAFDEARSHVDRAISILETEGDLRHANLIHIRGSALRGMGRWTEAMADLEIAIPIFQALDAPSETASALIELADIVAWSEADHAKLADMLQQALDDMPDAPAGVRARLLARAGHSTSYGKDYHAGLAMIEEALSAARAMGDPALAAECVALRGSVYRAFLKTGLAVVDLAEACAGATTVGARWQLARVGSLLDQSYLGGGDMRRSHDTRLAVRLAAEETGHIGATFMVEMNEGYAAWMETPNVSRFMARGERLARMKAPPLFRELAAWVVAQGRLETDEDPDPGRDMEGAFERARIPQWRDLLSCGQFLIDAYRQPARARAHLDGLLRRVPVAGQPAYGGQRAGLFSLVEGMAVLGLRDQAAGLYAGCLEVLEDGTVLTSETLVECGVAIAAACGANWDRAEHHFASALATAKRVPHVPGEAEVHRWHAWMLLSRRAPGDAERASMLVAEALAINERHGLVRRIRLCKEMRVEASR